MVPPRDREPDLGWELAGGHLVRVDACRAGRRAARAVPAARPAPVQLAVDLERGCLPNRFTPAAAAALGGLLDRGQVLPDGRPLGVVGVGRGGLQQPGAQGVELLGPGQDSSRQAVGTGSPIGNSGMRRWARDASGGVPAMVSVMVVLPHWSPCRGMAARGWRRSAAGHRPGAGRHTPGLGRG